MKLPRTVRFAGGWLSRGIGSRRPWGLRHGPSRNPAVLTRRARRSVSIPWSPPLHPLSETLAAGLRVAFVLARLANRFPLSAAVPPQTLPGAILAAPLERTVPESAYDDFRPPTALYRTRTAVPPDERTDGLAVARIGLGVAGHRGPGSSIGSRAIRPQPSASLAAGATPSPRSLARAGQ